MQKSAISRDLLNDEALFILRNLKENTRQDRSNKLADVKAMLEPSVSLEFDRYFFFLRKFHYIVLDREAQLSLTESGERAADGDGREKFAAELDAFFADELLLDADAVRRAHEAVASSATPPPVPRFDDATELGIALQPSPPVMGAPVIAPPATSYAMSGSHQGSSKGTELDLRYQKFDPVGTGPLGTAFKGRYTPLGLEVCVKELKDIFGYFSFLQRSEVIKRLKRELCAQAAVRHPGVVQVLDQNTEVARPYFVLELLRGSLRERLDAANGKPLPVGEALRWFFQLAYGLKAAHASGLMHHNLKPENVLFDAFGNAKLGDFGMGRVVEVDAAKGMPQVFVGTGGMAYMAPELMARAKDVGASADVYGLGILLYEMLTGQIPGRRSPLPSEVNPEAPASLDPIFDRMTQDKKEQRYADFDSLLDDVYKAFPKNEFLAKGDLILSSLSVQG